MNNLNENKSEICESKIYRQTDFACVAALYALGYKLDFLDSSRSDGRVEFCFIKEDGLEDMVQAHYSGKLNLPTINYFSAQRILKARLKNEVNRGQR